MAKEVSELDKIRSAINNYYLTLDRREHGGVAQNTAFSSIEQALGMHWEQGKALEEFNALNTELEIGDKTNYGVVVKITDEGRVVTDEHRQASFRRDGIRFISKAEDLEEDLIPR